MFQDETLKFVTFIVPVSNNTKSLYFSQHIFSYRDPTLMGSEVVLVSVFFKLQ